MEAEKSHSLLSAHCRPRKADGIIQSESGGLRTRGIDISPGLIPAIQQSGTSMSKAGEDPCSSLADRNSPFFGSFVLFRLPVDWLMPNWHWWERFFLLSSLIHMLISSRSILRDTPRVFYKLSGSPLAQSTWYIKLTITLLWSELCGP